MITEDYVSFKTAKLLKEKNFFSINCYTAYDENGDFFWYGDYSKDRRDIIDAPTLQMVMKWLRDTHGLFIHIDVIREASCWLADIQDIKGDVSIYPVKKEFPNYEEACETAIRYCLENLIN